MQGSKKCIIFFLISMIVFGESTVLAAQQPFYYGDQLRPTEKVIYNQLKALIVVDESPIKLNLPSDKINFTCSNPRSNESMVLALNNVIKRTYGNNIGYDAYCALIKDYPQICWIDSDNLRLRWHTMNQITAKSSKAFQAEIVFEMLPKKDIVYRDILDPTAEIDLKANEIINQTTSKDNSRYQNLKNLHDYLCNTVTYDADAVRAYDAYGALIDHKCVCEGYSEAFKVLCDKIDIPCILVSGYLVDTSMGTSERHMWNYVQMEDNKWYAVDVTCDDQEKYILTDLFLVGAQTQPTSFVSLGSNFSQHHIPEGSFMFGGKVFEYPQLSLERYNI